jgi:hypothetical protein
VVIKTIAGVASAPVTPPPTTPVATAATPSAPAATVPFALTFEPITNAAPAPIIPIGVAPAPTIPPTVPPTAAPTVPVTTAAPKPAATNPPVVAPVSGAWSKTGLKPKSKVSIYTLKGKLVKSIKVDATGTASATVKPGTYTVKATLASGKRTSVKETVA